MSIINGYYTVASAATEVGIRYKTLIKRVQRGKVKHEIMGRMRLIPESEVKRLIEEQARANH